MQSEDEAPIRPDVVGPTPGAPTASEAPISEPTKIIRIASMTKAMLEEVRTAPIDPAGRRRLLDIHERSLTELSEVLSEKPARRILRDLPAAHLRHAVGVRTAYCASTASWLA